jgi:hypothetical protein
MTLSDIKNIERDFLTPAQIAPILGADPNWIRWQAHEDPAKLGFPVIVIRSRVKIPKEPFIKFMMGELAS